MKTSTRNQRIKELRDQGVRVADIAARYGISAPRVSQIANSVARTEKKVEPVAEPVKEPVTKLNRMQAPNVDWDTVGDDLVVLAIILGIVAFISTVLVAW